MADEVRWSRGGGGGGGGGGGVRAAANRAAQPARSHDGEGLPVML